MKLSLMLTARCNASCSHCGTDCGPARTEALARDKLFDVMRQAARLSRGKRLDFGLTGGEPFLDLDLLRDLVAHGSRLGATVGCVTNASWATSDEKARAILVDLQAAGLTRLAISTSRFHQQFISRTRIERALRAAKVLDLPCTLKYVRVKSDVDDEIAVTQWATENGATAVQDFPVLPHLRTGEALDESEYSREAGLPPGTCPAPQLAISWDGQAYPCCTPGAFNMFLSLGNAHAQTLEQLVGRFESSGKQHLLRTRGPIHFARIIQARGLGHLLRRSYTNVCDLCTHIATSPRLTQVAQDATHDFEKRRLEDILEPIGEGTAPPEGASSFQGRET